MYITLEEARRHLILDEDFHDDDEYIRQLIVVCEDTIEKMIDKPLNTCLKRGELIPSLKHAVLLLLGSYYANRESITYGNAKEIPMTVSLLCQLNRNETVG